MQKAESGSAAFSSLTFKEQQEKWLEWRSRQLSYSEANVDEPQKISIPEKQAPERPPIVTPSPPPPVIAPPPMPFKPRHGELDQVYQKHMKAVKSASHFIKAEQT